MGHCMNTGNGRLMILPGHGFTKPCPDMKPLQSEANFRGAEKHPSEGRTDGPGQQFQHRTPEHVVFVGDEGGSGL